METKSQHLNIKNCKNVDQKSSVSNNKIKALTNSKDLLKQGNSNSQSLKSNKGPGNKKDKFLNVAVKKHNLHEPSSGFTDENKTWLKPAKDKKMPLENSDDNDSNFEDEEEEIDDDDDIEVSTENDEEQSEGEDEDEEDEGDEDEEDENEEDESFEDDNLDDSSTVAQKKILQKNKKKNIEEKVGYITKLRKAQCYYEKVILVFILKCKCSQMVDLKLNKIHIKTDKNLNRIL